MCRVAPRDPADIRYLYSLYPALMDGQRSHRVMESADACSMNENPSLLALDLCMSSPGSIQVQILIETCTNQSLALKTVTDYFTDTRFTRGLQGSRQCTCMLIERFHWPPSLELTERRADCQRPQKGGVVSIGAWKIADRVKRARALALAAGPGDL